MHVETHIEIVVEIQLDKYFDFKDKRSTKKDIVIINSHELSYIIQIYQFLKKKKKKTNQIYSSNFNVIDQTEFSKYTKFLTSISNKHPEFDFSIRKIVYKNDKNVLFKVENLKDNRFYYLQQTPIKSDDEIELILKQIQLSVEMANGCLLDYYTSFASRKGSFIFIVYDYIELYSLDEMLKDNNFQVQRLQISGQVQAQIFSIFYLLQKQKLSISNLVEENIYIYQNQGNFYVKLINITLIRRYEYMYNSNYWKLEEYEKQTLLTILGSLNSISNSQHFVGIDKDLNEDKYEFSKVKDYFNAYRKQYKVTEIPDIQMKHQDKKNLNFFLFNLNKEIKCQVLQKYTSSQNEFGTGLIFKEM